MVLPGADKEEKTAEFTFTLGSFDDYADQIKAYRKKHKLTQEELAAIMEVKYFTLRSWEQGKTKPPYHIWRQYKHLFDEPVDFP